MLPASLQVPAAAVLVVGGLLACFAGYRMFRIVLGIYGFVLGALAASSLMGTSDPVPMVIAAIAGGLAGAIVLILAYFMGVALVGAATGALIVHVIFGQLARDPHIAVVIAAAVLGALAALALVSPVYAWQKSDKAKKPIWHDNFARAKAEAKRADKILFVVFRCQP